MTAPMLSPYERIPVQIREATFLFDVPMGLLAIATGAVIGRCFLLFLNEFQLNSMAAVNKLGTQQGNCQALLQGLALGPRKKND